MSYRGKYRPKNEKKYEGNIETIEFRSLWERQLMKWCDENPDVVKWSSEEVIIPYISPVDRKQHRYFMDFKIEFQNGTVMLVEVKPDYQTKMPEKKKNARRSRYLKEAQTFAVNDAKWQAAEKYAKKRGWTFAIFTEHTLSAMGITIPSYRSKYAKLKKKTTLNG